VIELDVADDFVDGVEVGVQVASGRRDAVGEGVANPLAVLTLDDRQVEVGVSRWRPRTWCAMRSLVGVAS
jgi:hypothetical protein